MLHDASAEPGLFLYIELRLRQLVVLFWRYVLVEPAALSDAGRLVQLVFGLLWRQCLQRWSVHRRHGRRELLDQRRTLQRRVRRRVLRGVVVQRNHGPMCHQLDLWSIWPELLELGGVLLGPHVQRWRVWGGVRVPRVGPVVLGLERVLLRVVLHLRLLQRAARLPAVGSDVLGLERVLLRLVMQRRRVRRAAGLPRHWSDLLGLERMLLRPHLFWRHLRERSRVWPDRSELHELEWVLLGAHLQQRNVWSATDVRRDRQRVLDLLPMLQHLAVLRRAAGEDVSLDLRAARRRGRHHRRLLPRPVPRHARVVHALKLDRGTDSR